MAQLKKKIRFFLIPLFIVLLQRLLLLTIRRVYIGKENLPTEPGAWILTLWHQNALYAPILHENRGITVLISPSDDGELITRLIRRLGNDAVRGSSSRGGLEALKEMLKVLRRGKPVAVTPDGPRGPLFEAKGGVVVASQKAEAPMIPFHYECNRQWILRSWDKHKVPKPFAKMVISYGPPLQIPKNLDNKGFNAALAAATAALEANRQVCLKKVQELTR